MDPPTMSVLNFSKNSHFQNPPSPHDIMHRWSLICLLKKLKVDSQKIIKLLNYNFPILSNNKTEKSFSLQGYSIIVRNVHK